MGDGEEARRAECGPELKPCAAAVSMTSRLGHASSCFREAVPSYRHVLSTRLQAPGLKERIGASRLSGPEGRRRRAEPCREHC